MMPIMQIGPIAVPVPAFLIILGIWLGLALSERHISRFGLSSDLLFNLVLVSFVSGVLGARLAYLLRYPQAFTGSLRDIFSRNLGLFDPFVGGVVSLVVSAIYAQRKRLALRSTLDAITPALAVFAIALNLSHLASGDAYGVPANLPWSITLWGAQRHPTQIYQTIAALLILGYLWPGRKFVAIFKPGEYFLRFATLTAASSLFLEGFRGDSSLLPGGIRLAQILAWLSLAFCLYAIGRLIPDTGPK